MFFLHRYVMLRNGISVTWLLQAWSLFFDESPNRHEIDDPSAWSLAAQRLSHHINVDEVEARQNEMIEAVDEKKAVEDEDVWLVLSGLNQR